LPRPFCRRRIEEKPAASLFRPAGISAREQGEIAMTLDEFEAVRLADLKGLYQTQDLTVEDAVSSFKSGTLREATPAQACRHHGPGHGDTCH